MPPEPATAVDPRDAALHILRTLRDAGYTAYLAGGCVRDQLLGLTPKDFDVATSATPSQVQQRFPRSNAVGAAFGVVLVYTNHGKERISTEVATFRSDGHYADGRRPDSVTFTDAKHDAQRRDFTVNGLFLDPLHPATCNPHADDDGVIDYVAGRADLDARLLRAIGDPDQRFAEDFLRMLRAIRFAARFRFTIEARTTHAIRAHADQLADIARERIGDEVQRMIADITSERAADAATLLVDLGLDAPIFGNPIADRATPDTLRRLPDHADYPTRLVAWLPALSPSELRRSLCLSNEHSAAIRDLRHILHRVPTLPAQPVAGRKRLYAHARFEDALQILRADPATAHCAAERDAERHALAADGIGLAPPPLLTGDALIAAGHRPGPQFKTQLDAAYDAQLEGRITTADQALALLKAQEAHGR